MFGTRWPLFRLLGIPVAIDASWLIILALLTTTLAGALPEFVRAYYPEVVGEHPVWVYWLLGLLAALGFFVCIVLHELGHALVGQAQRLRIRGITLFLFGGVAELDEEPRSALGEFLMAIAGPVVSVVLAVLFGFLAWLGYHQGWVPEAVVVLAYLATINGLVLVFNLVPAFPLDGGRVLRSILWGTTGSLHTATYWAALAGRVFAWVLIVWGLLNFFAGALLGGLWLVLIGLFLNNAALAGYQHVLIRQALAGEPVARFMTPDPISVPPEIDLRKWLEEYVYRHDRKAFPVVAADGRLLGLVQTRSLGEIDRAEWDRHTVEEVMLRDLSAVIISPQADALAALKRLQRTGASCLLVADGEQLVGVVTLADLLRFLNLKLELEGVDDATPPLSRSDVAAAVPTEPHSR